MQIDFDVIFRRDSITLYHFTVDYNILNYHIQMMQCNVLIYHCISHTV